MTNLTQKIIENQVAWPAILALAGENELAYFENFQAWASDPEINSMLFTQGDRLIDVCGRVFHLCQADLQVKHTSDVAQSVSVTQLAELIRAHESQLGSCCVAKMVIKDIKQGFEALRHSLKSDK